MNCEGRGVSTYCLDKARPTLQWDPTHIPDGRIVQACVILSQGHEVREEHLLGWSELN